MVNSAILRIKEWYCAMPKCKGKRTIRQKSNCFVCFDVFFPFFRLIRSQVSAFQLVFQLFFYYSYPLWICMFFAYALILFLLNSLNNSPHIIRYRMELTSFTHTELFVNKLRSWKLKQKSCIQWHELLRVYSVIKNVWNTHFQCIRSDWRNAC